jgi:hypothetical protein
MPTKVMRTKQVCNNLKTAPGTHGKTIVGAVIGAYETIVVSPTIDDGYVLIVGPNPPINADGTYLGYGTNAWVEWAHLEEVNVDKTIIQVEIDWINKTTRVI